MGEGSLNLGFNPLLQGKCHSIKCICSLLHAISNSARKHISRPKLYKWWMKKNIYASDQSFQHRDGIYLSESFEKSATKPAQRVENLYSLSILCLDLLLKKILAGSIFYYRIEMCIAFQLYSFMTNLHEENLRMCTKFSSFI